MPQRLLQHVARLRSRQILLMGKPRMRNARRPSSAHLQPAAPVSTAVRKVFDGLGTWVAGSLSAVPGQMVVVFGRLLRLPRGLHLAIIDRAVESR